MNKLSKSWKLTTMAATTSYDHMLGSFDPFFSHYAYHLKETMEKITER